VDTRPAFEKPGGPDRVSFKANSSCSTLKVAELFAKRMRDLWESVKVTLEQLDTLN
jgi:hypothetical protein